MAKEKKEEKVAEDVTVKKVTEKKVAKKENVKVSDEKTEKVEEVPTKKVETKVNLSETTGEEMDASVNKGVVESQPEEKEKNPSKKEEKSNEKPKKSDENDYLKASIKRWKVKLEKHNLTAEDFIKNYPNHPAINIIKELLKKNKIKTNE